MIDKLRRIWYVLRSPRHSVYVHCPICWTWGVNFPGDPVCGNCGYTPCVEYYPCGSPDENWPFAQVHATVEEKVDPFSDDRKRVEADRHYSVDGWKTGCGVVILPIPTGCKHIPWTQDWRYITCDLCRMTQERTP